MLLHLEYIMYLEDDMRSLNGGARTQVATIAATSVPIGVARQVGYQLVLEGAAPVRDTRMGVRHYRFEHSRRFAESRG